MAEHLTRKALLNREGYSACRRQALKLWVVLARCYNSFAHAEALSHKDADLTPPQFAVLEVLAHLGPLKMCEIAGKLLMSGANVTGVVDRLEEKGLVKRVTASDDRRMFRIHLTEAGGRLIAEIFPRHAAAIERLTSALTPHEKDTLIRLLKKLGKSLATPR
ncbi:MAG: MarR family transcriptional regulator [candidate division KSB1 bacterium]|nr:MarR family transcriptional regulator [candidate division KSB1 bacterium]MDZ7272698.1 MarR family transcriptional regulator [candidate division KSB1 bacterium]MDZ7284279.1 MarR family transcriptional regulator [candidate division KSB1 bacterium]MDZ7297325.1 MarR family transcriptional regulator [candidate division KSB1 bacterium]MDZ7308393.1 MarR family transcriptional regulator [candidate division KSB1 bacterium]